MKGVIFNVLEDFVVDGWGEDAYEKILGQCPLKTKEPFVGPGTYPDADLFAIATKAAEAVGVPLPDALRAFGKYMFPKLVEKYPGFVADHTSAKSFLQSVHDVIHVEVRKLFPKAVTPSFTYEDTGEDTLVIHYKSGRKLCHLMEGMLESAGAQFNEKILHEQTACMHDGAAECRFALRFVQNDEKAA